LYSLHVTHRGDVAVCFSSQDRDSGAHDEAGSVHENVSEGDSTAPLTLLHEISMRALMVSVHPALSRTEGAGATPYYPVILFQDRYFADRSAATDTTLLPSFNEVLRSEAQDAAAKIYSVKPHPTQPHLCVAVTSFGIVVVSLNLSLVRLFPFLFAPSGT
jgi:hypothetical protein